MDWHGLIGVCLLTFGGGVLGLTLFQAVGGRLRPTQIGEQVAASAGTILVGLAMQPGNDAHGTTLLVAGAATLISSSLLTARRLRRLPGAREDVTRKLP